MKKVICLVVALLVIAGCGSSKDSSADKAKDSDKLVIWSFYEGLPKAAADAYEKAGGKVEFINIGGDDIQTKLDAVLGSSEAPDIVILENAWTGKYLSRPEFLDLESTFSKSEKMKDYIENTVLPTKAGGMIDGKVKALGWELTSGAFYYRNDLAKDILNINSVEEMEERINTVDKFLALQDELNAKNSGKKLIGEIDQLGAAFRNSAQTVPYVKDGTFTLTKSLQDAIEEQKKLVEKGIYFTQGDGTMREAGAKQDAFLGDVAPAWFINNIKKYGQDGKWSIAKSPFTYSEGGSFLAVTETANKDAVQKFLETTFLDTNWLYNNMKEHVGIVGNKAVMELYAKDDANEDPYFAGQDVGTKLFEIASEANTVRPITAYDGGIGSAVWNGNYEYVYWKNIKTKEEMVNFITTEVKKLYPDLKIVVE